MLAKKTNELDIILRNYVSCNTAYDILDKNIKNCFKIHSQILNYNYDIIIRIVNAITYKDKNFINNDVIYEDKSHFQGSLYEKYLLFTYLKHFCENETSFIIEQHTDFPDFIVRANNSQNVLALEITRVTNSKVEANLIQFNKDNQIRNCNNNHIKTVSYCDLLSKYSKDDLMNDKYKDIKLYPCNYLFNKCIKETCRMLEIKIEKFNKYYNQLRQKQYNVILISIERIFSEEWESPEHVKIFLAYLKEEIHNNPKIYNWLKYSGQAVISVEWADRKQQEKYGEISFHPIVI